MIDLSYLTEEEQEMIMTVLKRDAELKRAEEERVRQLQTLLPDKGKLKYMTGEWFYEAKSQRHLDRIHGSDIIRASMKQRKPVTLLDLSHSWTEKTNTVNNRNWDVVLPPEPSVPKEEPPAEAEEERERDVCPEPQQDRLKTVLQSPAKQRHNPFNTVPLGLDTPDDADDQLKGAAELAWTPEGELSSPSKTDIADLADVNLEGSHTEVAPVPKKRTIIFRPQNSFSDSDGSFPGWANWREWHSRSSTPRGILKHTPSWSSNDSGLVQHTVGRQPEPCNQEREHGAAALPRERAEEEILSESLDRKQVRFSPMVSPSDPEMVFELQEGRDLGEHDLLDLGGEGGEEGEGADTSWSAARPLQDNAFSSFLSQEPKPAWRVCSELPPSGSRSPHTSKPENKRIPGIWNEVGIGEAMESRWETERRRCDVDLSQNPLDQHVCHAESRSPQVPYLPSPENENDMRMGALEVPSKTTTQSPELTEEEGDSIAKVLEWFSRSSDSSDRQEEDVCQHSREEVKDKPSLVEDDVTMKTMETEDVPLPAVQPPKLRRLQVDISSRAEEQDMAYEENVEKVQMSLSESPEPAKEESMLEHHPVHSSLNTETAYQPKLRMSTADTRLQNEDKEKAMDKREEGDKEATTIPYSSVIKDDCPELKEKDVKSEKPLKVANLKSFWERGNAGPKILISRLSTDSRTNEARKESTNQTDISRKDPEFDVHPSEPGQEILPQAEGVCPTTEDKENIYGKYVSHFKAGKEIGQLSPPLHSKGMPVNVDSSKEVAVQSVPPTTQQDIPKRGRSHSLETALASTCVEKTPPSSESSCPPADENEEEVKYVAECVIIDEEERASLVEAKADFRASPQGEETLVETVTPSRHMTEQKTSPISAVRQGPNRPDSSIGKIRHLRSFWESEKSGPKIITGKSKEEEAENKDKQFLETSPAHMNKRFATSVFDLRTIGTEVSVDSDESVDSSPLNQRPTFTVLSMKEKMEKASTGQGLTHSQFKNLRDFWDGAPSSQQHPRPPSTENRPLSPKISQSKIQESSGMIQQKGKSPSAERKPYLNPNYYPRVSSKDLEKIYARPSRAESSPLKAYPIDISSPRQSKEKGILSSAIPPRQDEVESVVTKPTIESSLSLHRITGQEKIAYLPQGRRGSEQTSETRDLAAQDKESRPQPTRRTSLGNMTGKVNPLRRATSMYVVNLSEAQLSQASPERSRMSKEGHSQEASPNRSRKLNKEQPRRALLDYSGSSNEEQPLRVSLDRSRKLNEEHPRQASLDCSRKSNEEQPRRASLDRFRSSNEEQPRQASVDVSRRWNEEQPQQALLDRSRKSNEGHPRQASLDRSRKSNEGHPRQASLDRSRKSNEGHPRQASLDRSRKSNEGHPRQASLDRSRKSNEGHPRQASLDRSRKSNEEQPRRTSPEYSRKSNKAQPRQVSLDRSRKLDEEQPRRPSLECSRNLNEEQHSQVSPERSRKLNEVQPRRASLESSRKLQEAQQRARQPTHREASERRPSGASGASGESESPQPLARSFIPRNYQHYLGLPERVATVPFQSTPVSEKKEVGRSCLSPELQLEMSVEGPVRASTPVGSEESRVRKGSMGQRSWYSPRGTDDTEFDSYRSSTPETWSHSGASSACDDEDQNPVRLALKRATLKPMSSSKSFEDITSLPMRKERSSVNPRRELMLSMDDDLETNVHPSPKGIIQTFSTVPSSPASSISDPNQMKKMSKSVPSFLQKENDGRESDSTSENSVYSGRQMRMGSSLTNLSSSSGLASVSSVSGSVVSIYSGDFSSVEVRGTIQFSLNYMQKLKEFHIFVVRCRDLAAVDVGKNRSNPYVKCYLLPDQLKLGKRKTSVKKKTLNPTFNEILRYRIRMETLKTQTLNLSVWHNDTFGRNSFLGEVDVDLSKWDFNNTQMNNFTLKPRTPSGLQPSEFRGEMRLALRFLPQITYSNRASNTGEVHIWVKDCKDLPIIRGTSIDPFVKCFVLPDTSRKSRQKTRVLKRTTDPAFNHTMVYDGFRTEDLPEACVELTVWDHDRIANHFVGGLRLGLGTGKSYGAVVDWMDSNAAETSLWERMMDSPNEWVEDVLPLRMLTMAKNMWK